MTRLLFINPDEKLSQMYLNQLKNHFLVDSVSNGLSAVRQIRLSVPNIIVSEYILPILSGTTLLRFVRSSDRFSHIPFLFLSNHFDNTKALSLGANDWLTLGSMTPDYLLDRVYHHLKTNKHGVQVY